MKTVPAGEFKENCPRLTEEVSQTGQPLLITKRGKPLVEIHPVAGWPGKTENEYESGLETIM